MKASLLQVCIGQVQERRFGDRVTRTAIHKSPVAEAYLGPGCLEGDEVGNPELHGSAHQAVLLYASEHYPQWRAELALTEDWPAGSFGENLHLAGLSEAEACLGDVWAVGPKARLRFTIPRRPCFKLAGHLGVPNMVQAVRDSARSGWYASVEEEGVLAPGQSLTRLEHPHPEWPYTRIWAAMNAPEAHREALVELAGSSIWPEAWKERLHKLAQA